VVGSKQEEVGMETENGTHRKTDTVYRRTLETYRQAVHDLAKLVGKCSVEDFQRAMAQAEAAREAFEAQRKTHGHIYFPTRGRTIQK
jgi:hypothetical protein